MKYDDRECIHKTTVECLANACGLRKDPDCKSTNAFDCFALGCDASHLNIQPK